MKFRSRSNMPERVSFETVGPSLTVQGMREQSDVNVIMDRYLKTGHLANVRDNPGRFEDVSQFGDFHEMQNIVIEAQQRFAELPAKARQYFGNDPGSFIEFMSDLDNNYAEAERLGLISLHSGPLDVTVLGDTPTGKEVSEDEEAG